MSAPYNQFAGQSLERLSTLSDGVFAIAMTLLVLDLRVPASQAHQSEQALLLALWGLAPRFIPYLMSFMTLGIFWVGQQTQFDQFKRSNRNLTWIHLGFLLCVTLMPFSTSLLAEFIDLRTALLVYWFNILLLGVTLFASRRYASHAHLLKDTITRDIERTTERRIVIAQALYAIGAAFCIISTHVSIAAIVLVQLNYVIAPRIRSLYRL